MEITELESRHLKQLLNLYIQLHGEAISVGDSRVIGA